MKKVINWVLDHLKLVFTLVVVVVTAIVVTVVMTSSYNSYKSYVKEFDANDLEVRSQQAAQPIATDIAKSYSSPYGKKLSFDASELTVETTQEEYLIGDYIDLTEKGGTVSVALELQEKSFVDVVFTIYTDYKVAGEDGEDVYGIEDVLSNISVTVNGEQMDDVVALPGQAWYKLSLSGFALPEGDVNVTFASVSGKNAMMPQLKNITFFSSERLINK